MKKCILFIMLLVIANSNAQIRILKDINLGQNGSDINFMKVFKNQLYFIPSDEEDKIKLWVSDGTTKGTRIFKDLSFGLSFSKCTGMEVVDDILYFLVSKPPSSYNQLWRCDGTEGGTFQIVDSAGLIMSNVITNSLSTTSKELSFKVIDNGIEFLWVTDGTIKGTKRVSNIESTSGKVYSFYGKLGTRYLFTFFDSSRTDLYSSDENDTNYLNLTNMGISSPASLNEYYTEYDSMFLFLATDSVYGQELWRSDGTIEGTFMVKDINPKSFSSRPRLLTRYQDKILFTTQATNPEELWITDGTEAGTEKILELMDNFRMVKIIPASNGVYIELYEFGIGGSIWKLQSNTLVKIVGLDANNMFYISEFATLDSLLYVAHYHNTTGNTIWVTDGTQNGTKKLHTINDYKIGQSSLLTIYNKHLYFKGFNYSTGFELFTNNPNITSIKSQQFNNAIKIYPNPTSDYLQIDWSNLKQSGSNSTVNIQVFDVLGHVVLQENIPMDISRKELDVYYLSKGMYTLTIQTNEQVFSSQFLKH
ncbi:MAG: T9SS type A sorting domain-containing protein [Bacteroidia bacterium]